MTRTACPDSNSRGYWTGNGGCPARRDNAERQLQAKDGSGSVGGSRIDAPAVALGDLAYQRESQPGALRSVRPGVGRAHELQKELLAELLRHADALVPHAQDGDVLADAQLHDHFPARQRVLDRVVNEILDRVHQVRRHAPVQDGHVMAHRGSTHAPLLGERRQRVEQIREQLIEVDVTRPRRALPPLADLRQIEQAVDEQNQPIHPVRRTVESTAARGRTPVPRSRSRSPRGSCGRCRAATGADGPTRACSGTCAAPALRARR